VRRRSGDEKGGGAGQSRVKLGRPIWPFGQRGTAGPS